MFFVHPQIKLNKGNFQKIFLSFFGKLDLGKLQEKFAVFFPDKKIVFTDMGRTAFGIIIEKLNLQNSSMLVPAYICDIFYVVFKKYNITPIFLDADKETFNIDLQLLKSLIVANNVIQKSKQSNKIDLSPSTQRIECLVARNGKKVKSILVSHIYGLPNDMETIKSIAEEYNLKIIEDCAHSFGAKFQGQYTGNFGDAALFSLYKFLPTFRGGMLVCPKNWEIDLPKTKFNTRDFISFLNCFRFFAFLFKRFASPVAGQMIRKEKMNEPAQINNVSLNLFSCFLDDCQQNREKRIEFALYLQQGLKKQGFDVQETKNNVFCYVSALMPRKSSFASAEAMEDKESQRNALVKKLKKHKIFCTRMWHTPLILNPQVQKEYNINLDEFPNTKDISQRIINFPLQNFYTHKAIDKILKRCYDGVDEK